MDREKCDTKRTQRKNKWTREENREKQRGLGIKGSSLGIPWRLCTHVTMSTDTPGNILLLHEISIGNGFHPCVVSVGALHYEYFKSFDWFKCVGSLRSRRPPRSARSQNKLLIVRSIRFITVCVHGGPMLPVYYYIPLSRSHRPYPCLPLPRPLPAPLPLPPPPLLLPLYADVSQ